MRNRSQNVQTRVGKKKAILMVISTLVVIIVSAFFIIRALIDTYNPPKLDSNAIKGTPTVDESFLYGPCSTKYNYMVSLAANLYQQEDNSLKIYLTNPSENSALLQCKITDVNTGNVLYKSGVIEPGYYVESIKGNKKISEACDVNVEIYAYEPDTWYSMGTTTLKMKLQPW